MWSLRLFQCASLLIIASISSAGATSLRIAPVTLDLPVSAKTATLGIRNEGKSPVTVQMRVFRWTQVDGFDRLEPTVDVVVSPPISKLLPHRDYVVRIVRVAKNPVRVEETYRLLVDELPSRVQRKNGTVALMIRQSLPVFFQSEISEPGSISWVALRRKGKVEIVARNAGTKRVKISNLNISAGDRRQLLRQDGLSGYILGQSTKQWSIPTSAAQLGPGNKLRISGESSSGRINTYATLRSGN